MHIFGRKEKLNSHYSDGEILDAYPHHLSYHVHIVEVMNGILQWIEKQTLAPYIKRMMFHIEPTIQDTLVYAILFIDCNGDGINIEKESIGKWIRTMNRTISNHNSMVLSKIYI